MTEEEAEHDLGISQELQQRKYCPLLQDICRFDCECYDNGEVYNGISIDKEKIYYLDKARCTCYVLKGKLE